MTVPLRGWSHGFLPSALFAALAAIAYPVWSVLTDSILGAGLAISLYLVAGTTLYVGGCSPRWTRGLAAGTVAGFLGMLLLIVATRPGEVAIGCALILGVCRSTIVGRSRPTRGLAVEAVLLVGGLLFARFLMFTGPFGAALSIWGFLLVQSLFFLIRGSEERRPETPDLDPFEQSRTRALALIDDEVG
jgi:hypothetical protein